MTENRDRERFNELMAELLDGKLADQQIDELQALMREDESLRSQYFEYLLTHAMLEWRHGIPQAVRTVSTEQQPIGDPSELPGGTVETVGSEAAKQPPKSNIPLVRIFQWGATSHTFYPLLAVLFVFAVGSAAMVIHWVSRPQGREIAANAQPAGSASRENPVVARLSAAVNCDWDSASPPNIGDAIKTGQPLKLVSGFAELRFDIGARVLLQSPVAITVDSPKCIRLESGKLTAEITRNEARGFKVLTPDGAFVDQGTEFGVEVPPSGGSRVHVFKGEVDLALGNQPKAVAHRLVANTGARMDPEASNVTFFQDTGETFVRSMDQSERDLHVLAYWRFEDHPVGTLLPDTHSNREVVVATVDSSFNGNDLYTFLTHTRPTFSEEVPAASVPQSGSSNRSCLDNTEFPGPASTRDLYTHSKFSHSSPIDIQRISPEKWTIEASIRIMETGRTQTFVGRDPGNQQTDRSRIPCLAFQITDDGHPAIQFKDSDGRVHSASAADFTVEPDHWYHVAAVSDGKQILLYMNSIDGHGYQLIAKTSLPAEGSTALAGGDANAAWSLGRGLARNGTAGQWFRGWIDEVRICDVSLQPSDFLFFESKSGSNSRHDLNSSGGPTIVKATDVE
jgi:hypothetical protein